MKIKNINKSSVSFRSVCRVTCIDHKSKLILVEIFQTHPTAKDYIAELKYSIGERLKLNVGDEFSCNVNDKGRLYLRKLKPKRVSTKKLKKFIESLKDLTF